VPQPPRQALRPLTFAFALPSQPDMLCFERYGGLFGEAADTRSGRLPGAAWMGRTREATSEGVHDSADEDGSQVAKRSNAGKEPSLLAETRENSREEGRHCALSAETENGNPG
jgi:hypothetical protein